MQMSIPYIPRTPPSSAHSPAPPYIPPSSYPSASASSSTVPQAQPVTRSRTLFYLSIRDSSGTSYSRKRRKVGKQYGEGFEGGDEEERLIGTEGNEEYGKGLPPKWVDISDEVEEILSRISPKITTLDKLHAKHVLPGFTDRSAEEREIERQTSDITRDFRKATTLISSISPTRGATRAETMTAKNVQRGLAQKIQEMSSMFRKKQRNYMQKLQGHAIKSKDLLTASGAIPLKSVDSYDDLGEDDYLPKATPSGLQSPGSYPNPYQNQLLTQTQTQMQSQIAVDIDVETRTKEITQIASSISELADLFRDLGNLVVEQGTVLDSVEYNVSVTAREMKGAVEELKIAKRYQSNTGRRRCMLLLVLLIVGMIIVLIYKPRYHDPPPPSLPGPPAEGDEPVPHPDWDDVVKAATSTATTGLKPGHPPNPDIGAAMGGLKPWLGTPGFIGTPVGDDDLI